MRLIALLLPLLMGAAAPTATPVECVVAVRYPASNPQQISLTVPDKGCDLEGIKTAMAITLARLHAR